MNVPALPHLGPKTHGYWMVLQQLLTDYLEPPDENEVLMFQLLATQHEPTPPSAEEKLDALGDAVRYVLFSAPGSEDETAALKVLGEVMATVDAPATLHELQDYLDRGRQRQVVGLRDRLKLAWRILRVKP